MTHRFIADVHLGKLARLLRLLGFDTNYKNDYSNSELLQLSRQESRVLLSRNASFEKQMNVQCFVVTSEDAFLQLKQVVNQFHLKEQFHPFTRCIVCNGILGPVAKENVLPLLEKNTAQYFDEFRQCNHCKRVYWKGSHYERMLKTIEHIVN